MPTDWGALVKDALKSLDAGVTSVPGSKLRFEMVRLAGESNQEFTTYLTGENLTFRQLVDIDGVDVHIRVGTDMLVGLEGAALPEPSSQGRTKLRQDVYLAFTRVSPEPFHYLVRRDKFAAEKLEGEASIQVEATTLDSLIARRTSFAESREDDRAKEDLLRSLRGFANPLAAFQRSLKEFQLGQSWHDFNYEAIRTEIGEWAKKNDTEMSAAWFTDTISADIQDAPQKILAEVARHMTDDEIRELRLPFSAIEKLYKSRGRRG